jgi:hypothetical protein
MDSNAGNLMPLVGTVAVKLSPYREADALPRRRAFCHAPCPQSAIAVMFGRHLPLDGLESAAPFQAAAKPASSASNQEGHRLNHGPQGLRFVGGGLN